MEKLTRIQQVETKEKEIKNLLFEKVRKENNFFLNKDIKSSENIHIFATKAKKSIAKDRYKGGTKGRSCFKLYNVIRVEWYDSFYHTDRIIEFFTLKEFNQYLENSRFANV